MPRPRDSLLQTPDCLLLLRDPAPCLTANLQSVLCNRYSVIAGIRSAFCLFDFLIPLTLSACPKPCNDKNLHDPPRISRPVARQRPPQFDKTCQNSTHFCHTTAFIRHAKPRTTDNGSKIRRGEHLTKSVTFALLHRFSKITPKPNRHKHAALHQQRQKRPGRKSPLHVPAFLHSWLPNDVRPIRELFRAILLDLLRSLCYLMFTPFFDLRPKAALWIRRFTAPLRGSAVQRPRA